MINDVKRNTDILPEQATDGGFFLIAGITTRKESTIIQILN